MEKKELGVGQYVTTGTAFIRGEFKPEKIKLVLSEQMKEAILEYLTESDDFHKLVCDITGTERKQVKVSQELEKLKEDYSYVCDRYKKEQQKSNYLLNKWRKEAARRLEAEKERDNAERHHKFIVDEIFSMLKEVECSSVRGIVDELKSERANGKLLAEENEMCRRENDKLKLNYEKTNKELEAQKDLVKKYVAKSKKMRRLSISDKGTFVPEKGEIFLAEVPNKGIDRKVKALVSKDREACEKCCFYGGELGFLCWGVRCITIDDETQLTFRMVSDGKI
ncbi:hypothetical protein BK649P1_00058 [Bacteroides phage BK649P1]|nr:hypothetical protein BK649P1_00058 [Bacteroides phage BK649P1]